MTPKAHDIHCMALRQLETALCLYFEREDYYSIITLAGAAEELFGSFLLKRLKDELREYFEQEKSIIIALTDDLQESINKLREKIKENDKLCREILEKLRNDEEPNNLPGKLLGGRNQEKKLLKDLEGIVDEKLEGLRKSSRESNDSLKMFLQSLKKIFNSYKPTMDSLVDAAVKIGEISGGEALSRRGVVGTANEMRNILKHGLLDERIVVKFDASGEAEHILDRAIGNYFKLTGNLTSAMQQFKDMHVQDNPQIRLCSASDEESSAPQ